MTDTFSKKEREKRKEQKKKEKEQRKADRKANAKSGSLEDMMAYIDENGNITSTPPDPTKKKREIKESDIVIGSRNIGGAEPEAPRKGKVMFFNTSKGYGFIKDAESQETIFVHANSLMAPIKDNDQVTFKTEQGPKGLAAVEVRKI
jgi:cold shock CspA family protein